MYVRNLRHGEDVPDDLFIGFVDEFLTNDLVWVLDHNDRIVAICVAMSAHGWLMILRIAATTDAPKTAILRLMRGVFGEAKRRGINFFMTMLDRDTKEGRSLRKVIMSRGGFAWSVDHFMGAGKVEDYIGGCVGGVCSYRPHKHYPSERPQGSANW